MTKLYRAYVLAHYKQQYKYVVGLGIVSLPNTNNTTPLTTISETTQNKNK